MSVALQFAGLPNLQHLTLFGGGHSSSVDSLLQLSRIVRLCILQPPLSSLASMTQLRHLDLDSLGPSCRCSS